MMNGQWVHGRASPICAAISLVVAATLVFVWLRPVSDQKCLATAMVDYRLSDMTVNGGSMREDQVKAMSKLHPHSLVAAYYESNASTIVDLLALTKAQHKATCVVHLRIGDVLERSSRREGSIDHVFEYGTDYHHPLSHYRSVIRLTKNYTRFVIMAGAHQTYHSSFRFSEAYIDGIASLFRSAGNDVSMRLGLNPDDDFRYGSNAACFVVGKGGYSHLIADGVTLQGGVVF